MNRLGAVAQLVEHLLCKQEVTGSIPVSSTNPKGYISAALVSMASITGFHPVGTGSSPVRRSNKNVLGVVA